MLFRYLEQCASVLKTLKDIKIGRSRKARPTVDAVGNEDCWIAKPLRSSGGAVAPRSLGSRGGQDTRDVLRWRADLDLVQHISQNIVEYLERRAGGERKRNRLVDKSVGSKINGRFESGLNPGKALGISHSPVQGHHQYHEERSRKRP